MFEPKILSKTTFLISILLFTHLIRTEAKIVNEGEEAPAADAPEGSEAAPADGKATPAKEEDSGPKCNVSLLNSFGLLGLEKPEELKLPICSNINESCCSHKDTLAMFDYLNTTEDFANLQDRLDFYKKVSSYFHCKMNVKFVNIRSILFFLQATLQLLNC